MKANDIVLRTVCTLCEGEGGVPPSQHIGRPTFGKCFRCHGKGYVDVPLSDIASNRRHYYPICHLCRQTVTWDLTHGVMQIRCPVHGVRFKVDAPVTSDK